MGKISNGTWKCPSLCVKCCFSSMATSPQTWALCICNKTCQQSPKPQVHSGSPNPEHFNTWRYLQVRLFLLPALAQTWLIHQLFSQAAVPARAAAQPTLPVPEQQQVQGTDCREVPALAAPPMQDSAFRSPRCSSSAPARACSHQLPGCSSSGYPFPTHYVHPKPLFDVQLQPKQDKTPRNAPS